MIRESAVLVLILVGMTAAGAIIGVCAGPAKAGAVRQQSVRVNRCYAVEADENGEPIEVSTTPGLEYRLIAQLAGVTRTLATIPCSDLPRTVSIGGMWPKSAVMGCVLDVCEPAR